MSREGSGKGLSPPVSFGRYLLERRLAAGGMAEIFLGRMDGPDQFHKNVVVKRMLPGMSANPRYAQMFVTEARLAARFNHPNLVHVYELVKEDDGYGLVMEYIEGVDLHHLIDAAQRKGRQIPPGFAAYFVAAAADGLGYAHALKDEDGRPLSVVHRDISPTNIIATWIGGVKVVDFGIAKHIEATQRTETGVVKGKLSYMSPEQVNAQVVDARSDIFSLGVVLYELLTLQRCFARATPFETIDAIRQLSRRPLSEVRPDVSLGLATVLDRMLAPLAERFESAMDCAHSLRAAVAPAKLPSSDEVAGFLTEIFETAARPSYSHVPDTESETETVVGTVPTVEVSKDGASVAATSIRSSSSPVVVMSPDATPVGRTPSGIVPAADRASAPTIPQRPVAGVTPLPSDGSLEETRDTDVDPTRISQKHVALRGAAQEKTLLTTPLPPPEGSPRHLPVALGGPPAAPHSESKERTELVEPSSLRGPVERTAPAPVPVLESADGHRGPRSVALGLLAFALVATAVALFLLRQDLGRVPIVEPAETASLPAKAPQVSAAPTEISPSDEPARGERDAADDEFVVVAEEPSNEAAGENTGLLTVTASLPSDVVVAGKVVGKTPLRGYPLAEGRHTIKVVARGQKASRKLTVAVDATALVQRNVEFREGRIGFDIKPWAEITVDGEKIGVTPLPPAKVYEGSHVVVIDNRELGVHERARVTVTAGKLTNVVRDLRKR